MKYILWILRIIVGGLFIFSGVVKANDPMGLSYKMSEFFEPEVWNIPWALDYVVPLSVAMIAFEIIAGVALLVGFGFRVFSFLLLLLIAFFTFLTAYVYLPHEFPSLLTKYPKFFPKLIEECGCFGDCIKISNAETFWKDVILLVFCIILFAFRKRIKPVFGGYPSAAIIILSAFFAFGFQWWTLEHLPVHDCLPYKVGNNLWEKTQLPPNAKKPVFQTTLIYSKDGVKKEFNMENYPWQDSTWIYDTTITKELVKGDLPEIKDFRIGDFDDVNADHTEEVLHSKGYVFLFFIRGIDKARADNLERLKKLADEAETHNIPTYILASDSRDITNKFLAKYGLNKFYVLKVDGVASKTGMRSNPGLILLKDGVVQNKWSFRDYPASIKMNGDKAELK